MENFKIKKGLGRGLSSLIGDTTINTNINKFIDILITKKLRNFLQKKAFLILSQCSFLDS